MGVVYAAFDEQLRRPVAVKFLPHALQADDDRLSRFRNETRTLWALNHPHVITIFEILQAEKTPFIAMEFVEGETLRTRLRAGRLPLRDAVDVALQVARALGAAHEKGIVHRDVKPENVMMRRDGYVKVLDFGVAILRAREHDMPSMLTGGSLETVTAGVAGTPAYMSPEQLDGRPVDARSDLFSLGVLLCEMATGTNPFAAGGVVEIIGAIQRTPSSAASLTAELPPDARDVIRTLLQRDPADRYRLAAGTGDRSSNLLGTLDMPARFSGWESAAAGGSRLHSRSWSEPESPRLSTGSSERRDWVREQATPEIIKLAAKDKGVQAFRLLQRGQLTPLTILTSLAPLRRPLAWLRCTKLPTGYALVEVEDYFSPAKTWLRLGITPLATGECQPATCDGESPSLASVSWFRPRRPETRWTSISRPLRGRRRGWCL